MIKQVSRDFFYKLASELPDERIQAAVGIVSQLSEVSKEDGQKEWQYVVNRLVTGLASSGQAARLGFSICLTEVVSFGLDTNKFRNIEDYFAMLNEKLHREKVKNGKEERGLLFGKLFGLQALLNEPLFGRVFTAGGKDVVMRDARAFMEQLIRLALSKNWLMEPCLFTLHQTIEKLAPVFSKPAQVEAIMQLLDEFQLTMTNEGLAIYLLLVHRLENTRELFAKGELQSKALLNTHWKNNDPLSKGNLSALSSVLRDASISDSQNTTTKGNWAPRLHFVWPIIIQLLASLQELPTSGPPAHKKRKKNRKEGTSAFIAFPEFWRASVDESLFNAKASSERKYLGLLAVETAIKLVKPSHVSYIFSENIIRTLINQASQQSRNLHKIAKKVLNSIVLTCEKEPSKVSPVVTSLLCGPHGSVNFDRLTKSKTVDNLISIKNLTKTDLLSLVQGLVRELATEKEEKTRKILVDILLHIVRAHKRNSEAEWLEPILASLVRLVYLKSEGDQVDQSDDADFKTHCKERLFSMLGELIYTSKSESLNVPTWPYVTFSILLKQSPSALAFKFDDGLKGEVSTFVDCLLQIRKEAEISNKNLHLRGLELMFSIILLELYFGDAESVSLLQELTSFYNDMKEAGNNFVGMTEILLSLVSQRKAIFRKLSLLIWEFFIDEVGANELSLLLSTLSARENKSGYAYLFENAGEYEEASEHCDDSEEEETSSSSDEASSSMENDSDSLEAEDDGLNADVTKIEQETTSALASALRLPNEIVNERGEIEHNFDDSQDIDDDDDDEDEDMEDEAMMKLDDQLSEIFKRRKEALDKLPTGNKRKKEVQESREIVTAFKHRVVDMLEIYCSKLNSKFSLGGGDSIMLENMIKMIPKLCACIRETLDRALASKVSKLVVGVICKLKLTGNSYDSLLEAELFPILEEIHNSVTGKPGQYPQVYYSTCSSASLFISKALVSISSDEETSKKLVDLYSSTMKRWIAGSQLQASFFTDFIHWLQLQNNKRKT